MVKTCWDTNLYENKHAFVWQYGEQLLELLSAKAGERILDLGCGTGQLTEKIAQTGAIAMGIDYSAEMIEKAKQNYSHLQFDVADARNFQVKEPFDAVFSNAALHWINEPEAVINCIWKALKPGGRFVAEFGGKGNVKAIVNALNQVLQEFGYPFLENANPWYFPSIGEYAKLLENRGFEVVYAVLFDRPTLLEGNNGIANWVQMFGSYFFTGLSAEQQINTMQAVENRLQPILYRNGNWYADYRRIRVFAMKGNN